MAIKKNKYEDYSKKTITSNKKTKDEKIIISKKTDAKKTIEVDYNNDEYAENPNYDSYMSEQLVNNALGNLGSRYKAGGTSKAGFDCSGLMFATFGIFDVKLPRTSNEQSRVGLKINPKEAKKGDLIFFRTNGRSVINHVGLIIEVNNNEVKFVHSSTSNGVMVSSTKEGYYKNAFAQINRVLQ